MVLYSVGCSIQLCSVYTLDKMLLFGLAISSTVIGCACYDAFYNICFPVLLPVSAVFVCLQILLKPLVGMAYSECKSCTGSQVS